MDLVDYSHVLSLEEFILFLDFYKAFHSAENPFILNTLNYFGFGQKFINLIGLLYNDINSSVTLEHGTESTGVSDRVATPLLYYLFWWQNY